MDNPTNTIPPESIHPDLVTIPDHERAHSQPRKKQWCFTLFYREEGVDVRFPDELPSSCTYLVCQRESCPDVTCPLRYDNMDRFSIIKDMYVTCPCNPITSTGSGPSITSVVGLDEYVKLKDLESVYSGQSNPMTIADISTGALYLVMRSQYAGVNSSVTVDGISRLRYKD